MESDAITANGMMSFLKESLIERSDGPAFPVHMIQGHHEIADALKPVCPASRSLAIPNAFTCKVPKAFTVMQELACMGISMALKTVASTMKILFTSDFSSHTLQIHRLSP
jgi:DNA-directed RNA polymerase beta subunit